MRNGDEAWLHGGYRMDRRESFLLYHVSHINLMCTLQKFNWAYVHFSCMIGMH